MLTPALLYVSAPQGLIGRHGRAMCIQSAMCGAETLGDCHREIGDLMADGLGYSDLLFCRQCMEDKACRLLWVEVPCHKLDDVGCREDATKMMLQSCHTACDGILSGS